jgi:DNA-binding CsgD family transcriptional regulator
MVNDLECAAGDELGLEVNRIRLEAEQAVETTSTPVFVMAVPTEEIIACSPSASLLLDPNGGSVLGHSVEEFTTDAPTGALALFARGRVNGYDAVRMLRRSGGADVAVRLWIHRYDRQPPTRYALVLLEAVALARGRQVKPHSLAASLVVGTVDRASRIERISSNAEDLFATPMGELLNSPLARLIEPTDAEQFTVALADTAAGQHSIVLHVGLRATRDDEERVRCEVLLLPLQPDLACAFVFRPEPTRPDGAQETSSVPAMLGRLCEAVDLAAVARSRYAAMTNQALPGFGKLSARELEIVVRLIEGDRVPAIAAQLYLSPSTVRSHLAVVYSKLNIGSQQDLLNLAKAARGEALTLGSPHPPS